MGAQNRLTRMRILFLSRWFPYPPNNGSKLRVFNLLKSLSEQHKITLLSFYEPGDDLSCRYMLEDYCTEIRTVPWKHFEPDSKKALRGYLSLTPRSMVDTYSRQLEITIRELLARYRYDMIIASQANMAAYCHRFQGIPALFEEVEVGAFYQQITQNSSFSRRFRSRLMWMKYQLYLGRLLQNFHYATVVSEPEKALLAHVTRSNKVEIIPNSINLKDYQNIRPVPEKNTLIFPGSLTFQVNYDAATWFLADIFPNILKRLPEASLTITGDHGGLPLPNNEQVTLTGYVDDVRPVVASSWLSLAPIRKGGGTRLKILESMALGTPVVSTTKGAEGLDVEHGKHLLIADTPQTFAEAVLTLLSDPDLRFHLAANAYQLVSNKYDWKANPAKIPKPC
jgi:polysaccharide biosynthesis protein PslH